MKRLQCLFRLLKHFFGLPSEINERAKAFDNIWKNQILLSKVSHISLETSDTFTEYQMDVSFDALKDIANAQDEANKKALSE